MDWDLAVSGVTNDLYGVPLFGSSNIAVGENGLILRSTNSGGSWYSQTSNTQKSIHSVEFSVNNTSRIYCAGDSGLILKTTNEGVSWGFQNSGTVNDLNSLFFYLDDNTGYVVGNSGTILKTTDGGGSITAIESSSEVANSPSGYSLDQNYPNPFNPVTRLKFEIPDFGFISLKIFDVKGREVKTLINKSLSGGKHETEFDGLNQPSGIYFYTLYSDGKLIDTKSMVLLK